MKLFLLALLSLVFVSVGDAHAETVLTIRGPLSDGFPNDGKVNVSIVQGRKVVFNSAKSGLFAKKQGFDYSIRLRFKGDFDPNKTVTRVCVAGHGSATALRHGGCIEDPKFDENNTLFYPVPRS